MGPGPGPARKRLRRGSLTTIAIIFVLVFALTQLLVVVLETAGHFDWLMNGHAAILATVVGWLGIPITCAGKMLYMTNHTLAIDLDCTGLTIAALYASLIIAYPLSARTRLLALAAGLPLIAVANMFRLVAVALASEYLDPGVFDFVHDYLFNVFMILVVVALWASSLQIARNHAART